MNQSTNQPINQSSNQLASPRTDQSGKLVSLQENSHANASSVCLPEAFVTRLKEIVPPQWYEQAIASFTAPKVTSFRLNTLKETANQTMTLLAEMLTLKAIPWMKNAWVIPAEQRALLTHSNAFANGDIYIQGLSSLLTPLMLAPKPGENVLDLAAAPGGKTLQIASMMQAQGYLAAVESVRGRFFKLKANVEKANAASFVRLFNADGRGVGRKTPERFDRVLLDAPCSSEARFNPEKPESFAYWGKGKIQQSARKQKALLRSAIDATRVGGVVLYSTCSMAPEENEYVVSHVLKRLGGAVELLPIKLPIENVQPGLTAWGQKKLKPQLDQTCRVIPTSQMDAFYLALLRKCDSTVI